MVYQPGSEGTFFGWLNQNETSPFVDGNGRTIFANNQEELLFTKDYLQQFIDIDSLTVGQDLSSQTRIFRGANALWFLAYYEGDFRQRTGLGQLLMDLRYAEISPEYVDIYSFWQMYYTHETEAEAGPTEIGQTLLYLGGGSTRDFTEEQRGKILNDFNRFLYKQGVISIE